MFYTAYEYTNIHMRWGCCCCPLIVMIYPLPETNSVEWHIIFGMQRNEYVTMSIGKWSHWFRVRHCELACLRYSSSNPFLAKLNYVLHNILRLLLNKSVFFFLFFHGKLKTSTHLMQCVFLFGWVCGTEAIRWMCECLCVCAVRLRRTFGQISPQFFIWQMSATVTQHKCSPCTYTHTHIHGEREREREHKQHMN